VSVGQKVDFGKFPTNKDNTSLKKGPDFLFQCTKQQQILIFAQRILLKVIRKIVKFNQLLQNPLIKNKGFRTDNAAFLDIRMEWIQNHVKFIGDNY
jgi:hypothetical protein